MNTAKAVPEITVFEPPLPGDLIQDLVDFWQGVFQTDYETMRGILNGREAGQNRDIVYLVTQGGKTVGTCHLTTAESNPELGGLGEVASDPQFRGRGIASGFWVG